MIKNTYKSIVLAGITILTSQSLFAWNPPVETERSSQGTVNRAAGCSPASSFMYLDFNNAKALIETGGNMWQDRSQSLAAYEIPKGSGNTAIYSGALWLGGEDVNGQLKVAAVMFRQGDDFWTGPLGGLTNPPSGAGFKQYGSAEINSQTCLDYDKFFPISRQEVELFRAWFDCNQDPSCDAATEYAGYSIPSSIINWPAHGDITKGEDFYLAPFKDVNGNGVYDPSNGDYPWYDLDDEIDCRSSRQVTLFGDYTIWWVFNDKGNIHTETNGDPVGMEIRAQAFAFATNDEINDMTFYNYELINRSTQTLQNTYFGQWVDADLGCSDDDYVGCDVSRGLGYTYNGDANDDAGACPGGGTPYGLNPPAIGVDFFEGPYQDNDGIDNPVFDGNTNNDRETMAIPGNGIGYGDGTIDNERFGMRRFLYHNRPGFGLAAQQDPDIAVDFYNYLRGIWKDGSRFVYGGTAHPQDPDADPNTFCDFMFPGDSDPLAWGIPNGQVQAPWTETTEGNPPGDRRFMQSAGPFTLLPGALNNITVGVVYARATTGDPYASVEKLKKADDKAQRLFENCFQILEGPDAPLVEIQELDKELILFVSNPAGNNVNESYVREDFNIDTSYDDRNYVFQGYVIYQLKNSDVGPAELNDVTKARIVAQCDIKDTVDRIINFIFDEDLGASVPTLMVDGANNGVKHSFRITEDMFAQGNTLLVNHKTYYYMAIAYGFNNFKTYIPTDPLALDGQQIPFISSRKSYDGGEIKEYSAVPHIVVPENGGTNQLAKYGAGVEITRLEGEGNGNRALKLTEASENQIVFNTRVNEATYQAGKGPIDVKVVDPLNLVADDFRLRFIPDTSITDAQAALSNASWELTRVSTGEVFNSSRSIRVQNEQIFPDLGFSITIQQYVHEEACTGKGLTELISFETEYSDPTKPWLSGVADRDGSDVRNWIRSGTTYDFSNTQWGDVFCSVSTTNQNTEGPFDPTQQFEGPSTWSPFALLGRESYPHTPAPIGSLTALNSSTLDRLPSVTIVFTADKSKWTRCPVLETQMNTSLAVGGAKQGEPRKSQSVDKNGNAAAVGSGVSTNPNDANYISETGMGWFPGYAINLETGERLNMAFGEDSWLANDNGRDMKFNPTSRISEGLFEPGLGAGFVAGGKHYVYVYDNTVRLNPTSQSNLSTPAYDNGQTLMQRLTGSTSDKLFAWRSCVWVGMPMLAEGETLLSNEVKVTLNVAQKYQRYATGGVHVANGTAGSLNNWNNLYKFNTGNLATVTNDADMADSTLNIINVVPNPYYGASHYETGRLDNRIKIVNLPDKCDIRIYNVAGTLIRTFTKDDNTITSIDWDLKNFNGVPIAGGVYIIHVEVPGVGERIVKWFGALRSPDLDNF